ncbi:MBL fold metallo-hydrolase [Lutibaculum baratangense]|uniref:Metal-dependent hydrolase n=1 Tax=Lutibaculum baratangense AMV1 TaxID=631454 RepID=V4RRE0_9HYPH|nr:MBL fold metallo-hydrolase [Lutibaculum baratangense]ESR25710.1 hypothetical protein N177_1543 [Lutibaculum baratangense AMV1]
MRKAALLLAGILSLGLAVVPPAAAQEGAREPEKCPRLIAGPPIPYLQTASMRVAQAEDMVDITFLGHASFWIESPAGVSIVTDYSDWQRPPRTPRIATMNIAHSSHHTTNPDPAIEFLLPGWGDGAEPAHYDLTVDDVWLRNVTTNIRGWNTTEYDRNSMFVFEVARLCIAHLGHLHHVPTKEHLDALGRIDIVLAPVDGSYTLDQEGMFETLALINAPVVIPMHFFGPSTLQRFVSRAREEGYEVDMRSSASIEVSFGTLPRSRTLIVLPGS